MFFLLVLVYMCMQAPSTSIASASTSCDSGKGICIDTSIEPCVGIRKTGYCPGTSDIVCCEPATTCDSDKGTCIDTNTDSCDGILKYGYCPGASNIVCCEPNGLPDICNGAGPPLLNGSYEFTLRNQGFSGYPGALAYIPTNFDKSASDIEVVVYIHGYYNCIRNIVRKQSDQCNCSTNGPIRESYNLIGQFENACSDLQITTGKGCNRVFIAAEVAYDQANDSPGKWANQDMLRDFLDELLAEHLSSIINSPSKPVYDASSISRLRIFSHSGGYYTIGDMAINGGMTDVVKELVLFDSLYANFNKFDAFVQSNLYNFGFSFSQFRFSSLYTQTGGTYTNNQNMYLRVKSMISEATSNYVPPADQEGALPLLLLDNSADNSEFTVTTEVDSFTSIFKLATCSHDDVPRNFFYSFLINAA